jgi:hypothetical protein
LTNSLTPPKISEIISPLPEEPLFKNGELELEGDDK